MSVTVTPLVDYLFKVRDNINPVKLPEHFTIILCRAVAQLPFLSQRIQRCKREHKNTGLTKVLLLTNTKHVKEPDRIDLNNIVRYLQYLKTTLRMKLSLRVDSMNIMNWFMNSVHQVHEDCKIHTRGVTW